MNMMLVQVRGPGSVLTRQRAPFLNTLLIQDVLADGDLQLAAEDQRAITPLFWSHIAPYGEVTLDMTRRISLSNDTIANGEQAGT